jgi:hypothetical protein
MSFYDELKSYGVDLARLTNLQEDFLLECRGLLSEKKDSVPYRQYYDRDQMLAMFEKFVHRLERENLKKKSHAEISTIQNMDFMPDLMSGGFDPDIFVSIQHEFIQYYEQKIDVLKDSDYRLYLEHDQILTIYERLVRRLEGETIQQKINHIKSLFYPA